VGGDEESDDGWDENLAQEFYDAPDEAQAAALLMQISGQQEPPHTRSRKRKQPAHLQDGVNLQGCVLDADLSDDQQRVAQARGESLRAAQTAAAAAKKGKGPSKQTAAAAAKKSKGPSKRAKVVVMG
jgi:hypothetical protein